MKNEEFGCAMQACRKVILHSSFLVLHFAKLSLYSSICMSPVLHLLFANLMYINASPRIEDIRQHKRNQEGNIEHHPQSKLTGTTVCQCQRTLKVVRRGIISCIVISSHKQQSKHSQHRTYTRKPNTFIKRLLQQNLSKPEEH